MKAVSVGLKAHFAQNVTSLALCWRIIRTDGQTYAFTTFDEDLVVSGITYISIAGFSRTAIATGSTGEVDNLEVTGFFIASGLIEEDLKNGLFDYATIYLFVVNWTNLSQGICRMRRGWLGECVRAPNGGFQAELRGLTQALVQEFGNVYQPICRADLGDNKCRIPIKPGFWVGNLSWASGSYCQAVVQSSDALMVAIFQAQNSGTSGSSEPVWDTTIGNTTADNDIVWKSVPYWRGVASVTGTVDQHNFTSSALSLPAASVTSSNVAVISVRGNVSSGTAVTISDGVNSIGIGPSSIDVNDFGAAGTIAGQVASAIAAHTLNMTLAVKNSLNIVLTNLSGQVGDITKVGDRLDSITIQNFMTPILDGGALTWLTGQNAGRSMEIKTYDAGSNIVTMWLGMYFPITIGDRFMYYAGCDKRRDTCQTVFNNILNFRGEPDMPNMDAYLQYPDQ
jgi:hypothetical protein